MPGFKPPENFDFSKPVEWPAWKQRFMRYRTASKLTGEGGAVQVSALIYAMGPESERIFQSFTLPAATEAIADPANHFDTVLKLFDTHFVPKRNVIHERAKFYSRSQSQSETIEQYVRALYELAEHTDFQNKDESIRDRLVLGIVDKELSQKLQLMKNLTLQTAIEEARHYELVKGQVDSQRKQEHSLDAVDKSRRRGGGRPGSRGNKNGARPSHHSNDEKCGKCGYKHPRDRCPAKGKKCDFCQRLNHFQSQCFDKLKTKSKKKVDQVEAGASEVYFMGSVAQNSSDAWRETLTIGEKKISFKLDTGADVSVISTDTFENLNPKPSLRKTNATLQSPGGKLSCLGTFQAEVKTNKSKTGNIEIYVLEGKSDNLLSRDAATYFDFVKRIDEVDESVYSTNVGSLKCTPIKIALKDDAQPYSQHTARRIPIPLLPKVEAELQRMEKDGVIERITEPTDWCAPIVPVMKPNGKVRLCTDFKRLNAAVKRERYILPTLDDITNKLQGSKIFSKLDATSGYWQIPLDQETAKLTTFITPFGRFFYKRLPFGISSASEIFQRVMEEMLGDIPGVECFQDDVLLHSEDTPKHEELKDQVHNRVKESGLTLNRGKCEFDQDEIEFLGHIFSADGVRPDPSKIAAILEMEDPTNVAELRRWLGMVNYLGRFLPDLSEHLAPVNGLLRKEEHWTWGQPQRHAVEKVKRMLIQAPTLAYYDPKKKTTVSADASNYGLGGVLLQEGDDGLKPVAFCSRTLTQAERGYAQIEKECLAMVWACEKFQRFLVGLEHFTALTDHRPLVSLVNIKDLQETPLRCQRLLMRLLRFNLTATYAPGKDLVVADTLSRCPLQVDEVHDELEGDVEEYVDGVASRWPATDKKLEEIRRETARDVNLRYTMDYVIEGWPQHKQDVKLAARDFFGIRNELSIHNRLLLRGDRIVIPFVLREEMIERIHDGHLGINKCRERANVSMWWPGMGKQIEERVTKCRHCLAKKPSQPSEPLISTEMPSKPFEMVAADIFEFNKSEYIVMVDYYSRWIDIAYLPNITSAEVITKLKSFFCRHGIPLTFVSDNAGQFTSDLFEEFAEKWNFVQTTSSPRYPQANGAAERAVRTAKEILAQDDPFLALLTYRATPIPELGASPAELAYGRRLRTTLPSLPSALKPRAVQQDKVRELDAKFKARQKAGYDRRHGVRSLPNLQPGEPVLVKLDGQKGWRQPAVVKDIVAPRSYLLETAGGGQLRRNRKHLRPDTAHDRDAVTSPRSLQAQRSAVQRGHDPSRVDDNLGRRDDVQPGRAEMSRGQARGQRGRPPGQRTAEMSRGQARGQRGTTAPEQRTVTPPGRRGGALGRRVDAPEGRADPEPTQGRHAGAPEGRADPEPLPEDQRQPETPIDDEPGHQEAPSTPYRTRAGRQIKRPVPYSP